ncbi:Radial spoke head protein 4 A, partial [Physocladia obscura]
MDDPTAEQNESNNEEGQESQNTAIGETPSSLRPSAAGRQPPSEPEISDASPATSTAAPQQDSSQDFASTENSTTPQILAATTTAAAPSQVAAAVPSTRASLVTSTTPYLKRKDVYIKPESELPEDVELQLARSFLLQNSEKSDMNLYDHLTLTVMRVLETRPRNPVDIFESISGEIKRSKFRTVDPTSSIFKPAYDSAPEIKISKEQMALYEQPSQEDPPEEGLGEIPDIMDLSNLWEWAGVSFGREETFMLFLSLRKLVAEKPLKSVRLWGKIYGLSANYIITEGELKDGVDDEDGNIANGILPEGSEGGAEGDAAVAAEGEAVDPETVAAAAADEASIPKPKVKIIPPLPRENRTG